MKKIFGILLLIILSLTLISCDLINDKNNIAKLNAKDKITTVTSDDITKFESILDKVDLSKIVIEYSNDFDLYFYSKKELEKETKYNHTNIQEIKAKGNLNSSFDSNINLISNIEFENFEINNTNNLFTNTIKGSGNIDLYNVINSKLSYINIDANITTFGTDVNVKGKYYNNSLIPNNLLDNVSLDFDLNKLFENIDLNEINNTLEKYNKYVSVYLSNSYFGFEVHLNNDNLSDLFPLIKEQVDFELNDIKDLNIILTFKVSKTGISLVANIEFDVDTPNLKLRLKTKTTITTTNKMKSFPNFDSYVKKDFDDIFNFGLN